jgi:hypothetical protein
VRSITADHGDRCRQPKSDLRTRDLFPDAVGRSSWNVLNARLLPKALGEPEFPGSFPEFERRNEAVVALRNSNRIIFADNRS